jgi:Ca2+-binding EF-hand superfamily protein
MKTILVLSIVLLATALDGCAMARAGDRGARREAAIEKLHEKFQSADGDHDGFLSRDEAAKGMPRLAAHFDDADTDHDGKLSQAEVGAYAAKMRAERK